MPSYAILRFKKLKGSALSSSDSHGGRTRETPNADPERQELNELLLGEDRELREMFEERVSEEGLWRRSNSVEVIEVMTTATRAHFEDERGNLVEEKVKAWERANVEWLREQYGDMVLKLKSHSDERTPHLTGYIIPAHEGRLNARAFIGSRAKLSHLQDEYARAMEPLGLERGVKGSRATHQDIGRFYGTIMRPVTLEIDRERIHAPARLDLVTERGREAYRDELIKRVLEQVEEQVETLRNQALLTREERSKREASEQRAAERVDVAERAAREAQSALEKEREDKAALEQLNAQMREMIMNIHQQAKAFEREAQALGRRFVDIPLVEVMSALGHQGEREGDAALSPAIFYPAHGRRVALSISENKLYTAEGQFLCDHSLDVVMLMMKAERNVDFKEEQALGWLAEKFGEPRALAAFVVRTESRATTHLDLTRPEREDQARQRSNILPERSSPAIDRDAARTQQEPEHRRGGSSSFGR